MANSIPLKIVSGQEAQFVLTDTIPTNNLGTGVASVTTFLRGDQTYAIPPGTSGVIYLSSNTGDSNTVVNTTAETNFTTNSCNYTLPANIATVNKLIRITAFGKFSTKNGAVGTFTLRLKKGATIIDTLTIALDSFVSNNGFQLLALIQFRSIGVGGTATSNISSIFNGASSGNAASGNGAQAWDTTISNTIQVSAQWGTANASNGITLEQIAFESIN
jgi:hypothetical protein